MSPGTDLTSRLARTLAAHAMRVAAPDHAEWTTAMIHEQEHLPSDAAALSWAVGCVFVSYRGRLRAAIKLPRMLRWVALLMILLVCLGPPCANFINVVVSTVHGYPPFPGARAMPYTVLQEGFIFGSATLIGPIGLAAALWTLSSPTHRLGTMFMVVLWTLTALSTAYVGVPAQSAEWRAVATSGQILTLILNFDLLPALGVALLQRLDVRRRRLAD